MTLLVCVIQVLKHRSLAARKDEIERKYVPYVTVCNYGSVNPE